MGKGETDRKTANWEAETQTENPTPVEAETETVSGAAAKPFGTYLIDKLKIAASLADVFLLSGLRAANQAG